MNRYLGLRRAAALLVSLTLLIFARVPALADDSDSAPETAQPEKSEPLKPAKSREDSPEPAQSAPARQDEDEDETNAPAESGAQQDESASEAQKPHKYKVSWTSDAFDGQTLNYSGELIVGVGTSICIDPEQDIALIRDGEPTGAPSAKEISLASSNERYMSVSEGGDLHAVRKGAAQLHVTVDLPGGGQKQLRKSVKIVEEPSIRFAPDSALLASGDDLDLGQFAKAPLLKAFPNVNAQVRYRLEPVLVGGDSRVELDAYTGKLCVSYTQPGDIYLVVAETYSGSQACFTLYLSEHTDPADPQPDADPDPDDPDADVARSHE